MVFESIVADILNRYLGDYVENLDRGQLKIGIWGGKFSFYQTYFFHFSDHRLIFHLIFFTKSYNFLD